MKRGMTEESNRVLRSQPAITSTNPPMIEMLLQKK
jgi:hypothetical protein